MSQRFANNIKNIVYLLIVVVVILSLAGASQGQIDFVVSIFGSMIVSAVFSLIAASLVEAFTGDFLKKILIPIEIGPLRFSISLFVIATAVLKLWIFH